MTLSSKVIHSHAISPDATIDATGVSPYLRAYRPHLCNSIIPVMAKDRSKTNCHLIVQQMCEKCFIKSKNLALNQLHTIYKLASTYVGKSGSFDG